MEFTKDIQFNNMPTENQDVTLTYTGFLSDSEELTIVYGFGESWAHTTEKRMSKTSNGFVVRVNLLDFDTFNFCFRNSNYQWDNNCNCNYISPILPYNHNKVQLLFDELVTPYEQPQVVGEFDIDALIEEMLQPILAKPEQTIEEITPVQISTEPIDLGVEITKILSQIDYNFSAEELAEYSTLDEILTGTVIEETPIEMFEESSSVDDIINEIIDNTKKYSNILEADSVIQQETTEKTEMVSSISEEQFLQYSEINEKISNIVDEVSSAKKLEVENSLIEIGDENSFIISPRQLSKFYLFRKRVKLAFYKALVKIPKLIFGSQEQ